MAKNIVQGNITNVGSVEIGDKIIYEKPTLPKALTVNIPRTPRDRIVGRDAELNDLHQLLFDNRKVVLVNGMGGIGKTTLAQTYVDQFWDDYKHIAWISQLSEDLINDFINAAKLLDNLNIQAAGKDAKDLFMSIVNELNKIDTHPNLLVIDNADASLAELADYLPHQPQWHILVTSRVAIENFDLLELDFLSSEEAVQLFLKYCTHDEIAPQEVEQLVLDVDLHTLTIEILAKTAQRQRIEIDRLRQAIKSNLKADVSVSHSKSKIERVTSYLSSIFSLSKLSEKEVWFLKQFTCLPATFLEYDLLKELIKPAESEQDNFSATLVDLTEKGWLLKTQKPNSYKMHLIIAEVVKQQKSIGLDDVRPLVGSITTKLDNDQSKDNPVDKFPWIPFGYSILNVFPESQNSIIALLQNSLAMALQDRGDYQKAKILLEKARRSAENIFGAEHPTTATISSNLAIVLRELGNFEAAKSILHEGLFAAERYYGPEHPNTAVACSNLAIVLQDLGEFERAKVLLERALHIDEINFGADDPRTATTYSNLALTLKTLGDYQRAQKLLEKAKYLNEHHFGADHLYTTTTYSNLALLLQALGDYQGSKTLLEKAIITDEKNLGADHPATIRSIINLASVLQDLGDNDGAKVLLEKALESEMMTYSADHPKTAIIYSNLAAALIAIGDYGSAKALLEKAIIIDEKTLNKGNPTTTSAYSNLATVFLKTGDYQRAKILFKKVMLSNEKSYGTEHPETAISYSMLAEVFQNLGNYERSIELAQKALNVFVTKLPQGHPFIKKALKQCNSIKQETIK